MIPIEKLSQETLDFYKQSAEEGNIYSNLYLFKILYGNENIKTLETKVNEYISNILQQIIKTQSFEKQTKSMISDFNTFTIPQFETTTISEEYLNKSLPIAESYYIFYLFTGNKELIYKAASSHFSKAYFFASIHKIIDEQYEASISLLLQGSRAGDYRCDEFLIRELIELKKYSEASEIFSNISYNYTNELKKLSGILDIVRGRYGCKSLNYLKENCENDIECKFFYGLHQLYQTKNASLLENLIENKENVLGYKNIGKCILNILGKAYLNGSVLPKNVEKAIEYFGKEIERGNEDYHDIIEAYKALNDKDRLFDYLVELSENQNVLGMVELGKLLLQNDDEDSKEMAMIWIDGAASLGNEEAVELMKKYFE